MGWELAKVILLDKLSTNRVSSDALCTATSGPLQEMSSSIIWNDCLTKTNKSKRKKEMTKNKKS